MSSVDKSASAGVEGGTSGPVIQQLVATMLDLAGPGRFLFIGRGAAAFVRALLGRGCDAHGMDTELTPQVSPGIPLSRVITGLVTGLPYEASSFDTVIVFECLDRLPVGSLAAALGEIHRVARRHVYVRIASPLVTQPDPLTWWQEQFLAAGFRRHPRAFCIVASGDARGEVWPLEFGIEKIDVLGTADFLERSGGDALAAHAFYCWVATRLRTNDVIVDLNAGGGDGLRVLASAGEFDRLIGIRASGIAAWRQAGEALVQINQDGDGDVVLPADGIDAAIWFGEEERAAPSEELLAKVTTALRPGGRLIVATPLSSLRSSALMVAGWRADEDQQLMVTPDGVAWKVALPEAQGSQPGGHAWRVRTWMRDPLVGVREHYRERCFGEPQAGHDNPTAFGRDYANPWIVSSLVLGPSRLRDRGALVALARDVLTTAPVGSADEGAALCVLAYRELENGEVWGHERAALFDRLEHYIARPADSAHARRWIISLTFAAALLQQRQGDLLAAEKWFVRCAVADALEFSPHLATKTTEASFRAGWLYRLRGERQFARKMWHRGLEIASSVGRLPLEAWLVSPAEPAGYEFGDGMREISLVFDNATLCSSALRALAREERGAATDWRLVERNFQRGQEGMLRWVAKQGGETAYWRQVADAREGLRAQLAAELNQAQESWRVAELATEAVRGRLCDSEQLVTKLGNELRVIGAMRDECLVMRRLLRRRAGQVLRRVVIVGVRPESARIWEALAVNGATEIIGFIAPHSGLSLKVFLGLPVYPLTELRRLGVDTVVVAGSTPESIMAQLAAQGMGAENIVEFPTEDDAAALARCAAQHFPDDFIQTAVSAETGADLRIGIFGTGSAAMKVWEALTGMDEAQAVWFADNNVQRQGTKFLWLDVIAPEAIPGRGCDFVVIGSMYRDPIRKQLIQIGVPADRILAPEVTGTAAQIGPLLESLIVEYAANHDRI